MKSKILYGTILAVLVTLSGVLYLYDRHKDEVVIETTSSATSENTAELMPAEKMILVHLTGAVENPDVYELPENSRLYELIELAGGFTEEGDETYLNLARYVFDGEKIHVPTMTEAEVEGTSGNTSSKVSINQADIDELMTLKGVGEAKAEAIISYREANGPFQRIEDIMNVDGIKEAMFKKIKDDIVI